MEATTGTDATTNDQRVRAEAFHELHRRDRPLLLANAWSAASARVAEAAGVEAIGTTSFGMALDHGRRDGDLPFAVAVAVAAEIVAAVDLPVTFDLEAGRGATPEDVHASMAAAIGTGVVGVNIEDSVPGAPGSLFEPPTQVERLQAARAAADAAGIPMFINARCDVFFGSSVPADQMEDEVLERAQAYAVAGANGLFLPGLVDLTVIRRLTSQTELPVNVMVMPGLPELNELADAGVRRVSQGGASFIAAVGALHSVATGYVGGALHPSMESVVAGMSVLPALMK